jgi:hypothetical protein
MTKVCTKCKQELPLSAFGIDRRSKSGITCQCSACLYDAIVAYRESTRYRDRYNRRKIAKALESDQIARGVKTCTQCHLELPLASFRRKKNGRYNKLPECRKCESIRDAAKNKEVDRHGSRGLVLMYKVWRREWIKSDWHKAWLEKYYNCDKHKAKLLKRHPVSLII